MAALENPFTGLTYANSVALIANRYSTRVALKFHDRTYTFADVRHEVDRASARLASLGLRPGDKVAIWMPNRPEFIWYWLGAAQMGLVAVFLNTRLRRDEFVYQIAQSDSRVVIVPGKPGFRDFLAELGNACPALRAGAPGEGSVFPMLRHIVACDPPHVDWPSVLDWSGDDGARANLPKATVTDPDLPALIAYSSGTTALPKGAMLTHVIWRKAYDGGNTLSLTPEDRLYLCVPLFGVLGSLNGILTFWSHGASVVLAERFEADACLDALFGEGCTAMHMLPAMIAALLQNPRFDRAQHRLRVGVVLSSDPKVLRQAALDLGVRGIVTGYGLTESTGLVTRCHWDQPLETRLTTQGKALPGCLIRVVDPETGVDLPPGQTGEIWVGGYSVMRGYYNKPEETRRAITPDGWLRSGDAGCLTEDGALVFQRRLGDGYKHKGFNVSIPEVEAVLRQHPDIAAVAIVGVPHPEFGEVGVAFVIPRDGASPGGDRLAAFLRERLASFKVPSHYAIVDSFPLTAGTEKVQKFRLRERALALATAERAAVGQSA